MILDGQTPLILLMIRFKLLSTWYRSKWLPVHALAGSVGRTTRVEMLNKVVMIELLKAISLEVLKRPKLTLWDCAHHQPGFSLD
ncbi:hypothetical protein [Synechococcus sp. MIT S1220]|uniref:hypothetical protein n=1 Tax=Synechococcus sp. MIT S1220 TaxID=3082549 RepID=UPI0039B1111F